MRLYLVGLKIAIIVCANYNNSNIYNTAESMLFPLKPGCLSPFFAIAAEVRKPRYIALKQGCKALYYLQDLIASPFYSTLANPGTTA